jgi:3-oxoacyl-[acyl-carrier protein] reductase
VRINAVAPSAIVTERLAAQPASVRDQIAKGFPLGRLGEVEDVVAATLFLLSDAAGWITGVTLDVAGGRVMV